MGSVNNISTSSGKKWKYIQPPEMGTKTVYNNFFFAEMTIL